MIQFGFQLGFGGFQALQPPQLTPAAAPAATSPEHTHTTANSTMSAPAGASPYPVAMFTPAYMMAFPQMGNPMGMSTMGMQGMGAPSSAADPGVAAGGHVTANPTNSTATSAMSASPMGGYGGFGGVGAYGGFAMPVMMMVPVFLQMGYPVFQGSQPQPPLVAQPPVDDVVAAPAQDPLPAEIVDPSARPPVNTDGVVIDVVPDVEPSSVQLPTLPIIELGAEDFARYRLLEKSMQQETSLSLELTTQDGDRITLDFSQIDSMQMSRFSGLTLAGAKMGDETFREETERVVNMDVVGDLSDAEKAAIDSVLASIVDAVREFFSGDTGQAVAKLKDMDFDSQQLAELSLNMSMSKSADVSKAYHDGADYLHELKDRDADIGQALEFLATEQKRLIDIAKNFFDAPSAARLVRSLVPPLLADPFSQLGAQIAAASSEVDAADDGDAADDSDVADDDVSPDQQG